MAAYASVVAAIGLRPLAAVLRNFERTFLMSPKCGHFYCGPTEEFAMVLE